MDEIKPGEDAPRCGSIFVENLEELPLSESEEMLTLQRSRVIWRPSADIDLPDGFELSFDCLTGSDGIRRFFPTAGIDPMILQASLIGHAIQKQHGMSPELSFSHHAMRLIFQHARRMHDTIGRVLAALDTASFQACLLDWVDQDRSCFIFIEQRALKQVPRSAGC